MARAIRQSLQGQIGLVVGGASPSGLAVIRALATRGALVALADFSDSECIEAAERLEAEGLAVQGMGLDAADPESVHAAFDLVSRTYGAPNLLCYGIGLHILKPTCEAPPELWTQGLLSNLGGSWLCACEYVKQLRALRKRHGAVVFMLSDLGEDYNDALTATTLAGLQAVCAAISQNWSDMDITALIVQSGPMPGSGAERTLQALANRRGLEWESFRKDWKRRYGRRLSTSLEALAQTVLQIAQRELVSAKNFIVRVPIRAK